MKNNIKKIIMVLVLGFLFVGGQSAFANNVFNGQSGDCNPAVGIGIYPNNIPRDSNGCWTATSISANAGDTINVAMYYHNNTNSSLNGVSGSIAKSGSGQNYTFIGKMSSSGNGSQLIGTVSLNLSSSQTLTYDSTHLMKGANAVINTQETASFNMDGGQIPVGSVPSGWDDYGEILVVYKVGSTIPQNNCSINNFHADDTSIDQGDSTELNWDTDNCDHVNITYLGNNLNPSDNATVSPSSTRTYVLKAYDSNGNMDATDSVTIYVDQNNNYNNCTINDFYADDTSIDQGDSTELNWDTDNCDHVNITYLGNNLNPSDTASVSPSSTRTYVLKAYDYNGNQDATDSVTIYVDQNNNYNDCTINDFYASPTSISSGSSSTLHWNTSNCSSVSISNLNYNVPTFGYQIVYPNYTTTYVLNAYGNGGSDSDSETVSVNNNNYNQNMSGSLTSATNSCAITSGNNTCNIHFYWSTINPIGTSAITKSTGGVVANGNSGSADLAVPYNAITFMLYNNASLLASKTVYSSCISGTFWNGSYCATPIVPVHNTVTYVPTNTTVVHNTTTVVGTNSPIMLKIENHFETVKTGDVIEYTVTYKNIGKTTIKDSILQIVLPKGITFENASRGTYASDTNTVSVLLEDLITNKEGTVYVQGKINSGKTEQVVTNATIIYTGTNGAQENAEAYVVNNINGDGSLLGAAAIWSGLTSVGLLGLLFIILIILFIIYFVRRNSARRV